MCTVREAEQHLRGIEPHPSLLLSHLLQPPSHYGVGCSYLSHAPGYDLIPYYKPRNSEATLIWPETKHIAPKLTFSGPKIIPLIQMQLIVRDTSSLLDIVEICVWHHKHTSLTQ